MSAYEPAKRAVDEMEARLYAAIESCDAMLEVLAGLARAEGGKRDANPELLRRYDHLRRQTTELRDVLEGPGLEALLPVMDRVLMIRTTEEGRFV